jgi:hypothetical protein
MTTKDELKQEINQYLIDKIQEIDLELDEVTMPLLEAKDNESNPDYEYANKQFDTLLNNTNRLKSVINQLIYKLNQL